ncbi:MAG TPA: ABC transporter permease, partial [Spirochaetota bacterium]|nr:ABC transporter permease [Spirochaetota bacterium]
MKGYWSIVWKRFKQNKLAVVGLCIVIFLFVIALCAPLIANNKPYILIYKDKLYFPILFEYPEFSGLDFKKIEGFKIFPPIPYSYSEYDLNAIVLPPSAKHILGTDEQGRDLAARMLYGTRVSIFVGFVAVFIYVSIGIIIGALAGFYGGWVDIIISRIIEIVMC